MVLQTAYRAARHVRKARKSAGIPTPRPTPIAILSDRLSPALSSPASTSVAEVSRVPVPGGSVLAEAAAEVSRVLVLDRDDVGGRSAQSKD